MPAFENIRKALLEDRARQVERERTRNSNRRRERMEFDPFDYDWSKAVVVAGGDPGYLPSTPMRKGSVGFHASCRTCGREFESKGMGSCPACLELPAEERRAMKPSFVGRLCEGPGCENFIPRTARADARYCSQACQQKAKRRRNDRDNPAQC